jgi:hypothetical protein
MRISWDPVGFVFIGLVRSYSSDLWLPSLLMVAALVCWSFEVLGQRLHVSLLQQALLRQTLSSWQMEVQKSSSHACVCSVARWSRYLFIYFFLTF